MKISARSLTLFLLFVQIDIESTFKNWNCFEIQLIFVDMVLQKRHYNNEERIDNEELFWKGNYSNLLEFVDNPGVSIVISGSIKPMAEERGMASDSRRYPAEYVKRKPLSKQMLYNKHYAYKFDIEEQMRNYQAPPKASNSHVHRNNCPF